MSNKTKRIVLMKLEDSTSTGRIYLDTDTKRLIKKMNSYPVEGFETVDGMSGRASFTAQSFKIIKGELGCVISFYTNKEGQRIKELYESGKIKFLPYIIGKTNRFKETMIIDIVAIVTEPINEA
jgi:hypothetical protein